MSEDDEVPPKPVVTGSPETIWLVYGELDRDATHEECAQHEAVTWCEDQHFDTDVCYVRAESQAAQIAALKTVMIAAAEEIAAHWQAHCDAEGYGPQNLLRRLEEGIPSEYGYTAGAFAALTAERDALRAALSNPPKHKFWGAGEPDCPGDLKASNGELHTLRCKVCGVTSPRDVVCLTAIDAARTQAHKEPT